jgi:hypothetical protein
LINVGLDLVGFITVRVEVETNISEERAAYILRAAKHLYLPTIPHGVTTQKMNFKPFTVVRTSNLT